MKKNNLIIAAALACSSLVGAEPIDLSLKKVDQTRIAQISPHLSKAQALFIEGKNTESSAEIFKAADQIHKLGVSDDVPPTKLITKAVTQLERLGERVLDGSIKNVKTLTNNFALASYEIATHYADQADQALAKNTPATEPLKRCADHTESLAHWAGKPLTKDDLAILKALRKPQKPNEKLLKDARSLIAKLHAGSGLEKFIPFKK